MLSHPPKSMRRSSRANCQTKPLQERFVAAQERSEAFALSQRIGKAVCRGLTQIENTFTKTSPARMSFGTHALIEELLGVTKRSVQPEKDSGNGNETATADFLPSTAAHFKSLASAISPHQRLRSLEFKHLIQAAKINFVYRAFAQWGRATRLAHPPCLYLLERLA